MIHLPRKAKITVQFTLRRGRDQISRKVTVDYPKKLYPFELKQEITACVAGFKTMSNVLRKVQEARLKVRPVRTSRSRVPFHRRRVRGKAIKLVPNSRFSR